MKLLKTLMTFLILISALFAKEPCDYATIEKDDFGTMKKEGIATMIGGGTVFHLKIKRENEKTFFSCKFTVRGADLKENPKGKLAKFALEDGTIITLSLLKNATPRISSGNNTDWDFEYVLSQKDLESFAKSRCKTIRMELPDEKRDFKLQNTGTKKFLNIAKCFAGME